MNGRDHYRRAEGLLERTEQIIREAAASRDDIRMQAAEESAVPSLAAAQVHATLALAAAHDEGY